MAFNKWCFLLKDGFACCMCRRIAQGPDRCEHCGHRRCELPDAVQKVEVLPECDDTPLQ